MPRLYVGKARLERGVELRLDDAQAHRLRDVLRLRIGDGLTVFDGRGHERAARIAAADAASVTLQLGEERRPAPEPPLPVTLVCAFPRGQRGDWLVEKATELGVAAIVPRSADRSVLRPGEGRIERWRRIAIEAAEQCGRASLPEFDAEPPPDAMRLLADLDAPLSIAGAISAADPPPPAVALYVGPEGGWSPEERERLLDGGARPVGLGPRRLRVETAAIVGVAQVLAATGGLSAH